MSESHGERRALVVEDDEDIRSLIEFTLSTQGFVVHAVDNGLAGVEEVRTFDPDLVTLDLGLPGIDGIETCRRIREISDAYVVMITARDEEIDRLLGLETGADDFFSKPFSVRELKARVNALFRRPRRGSGGAAPAGLLRSRPRRAVPDHEMLEHGPLRVDVDGRRAFTGVRRAGADPHRVRPAHRADAHPRPRLDARGAAALGLGHRLGHATPTWSRSTSATCAASSGRPQGRPASSRLCAASATAWRRWKADRRRLPR